MIGACLAFLVNCSLTNAIAAGHETTSSTLSWLLYELSRRPNYQRKVREEIKATRALAVGRGDESLSVADFESMTYTVAAMKVCMISHRKTE